MNISWRLILAGGAAHLARGQNKIRIAMVGKGHARHCGADTSELRKSGKLG